MCYGVQQKLQLGGLQMLDSIETDNNHTEKDFQSHFPAVDHSKKHYSLEPDIVTGWRPRNKIMGPIPLNFDAKLNDEIVDELTSFGSKYKERVVYLGHRFTSSFKMHQEMQRSYPFKHEGAMGANYQHMAAYFRKFHANFKSKNTRIFRGMNPSIKVGSQIAFDSNFQSGNLDTVIKTGENQYDLFMRIDTNTRGHLQWFNFKVKNYGKKKVKLNIVNFQKEKTLYQRGMKPYIYSQYLKQTKQADWFQGGDNVIYRKKKLGYSFLQQNHQIDEITPYCLSFSYSFQVDWQEVQFAYCPPFTYSDMTDMVVKLKRSVYSQMEQDCQETFLKEQNLGDSVGGLQIPLLTITDPRVDDKKKRCVLVSGRIHPGESCSSFVGQGLLEYICGDSDQARYMRRTIVFKVIPMLNPDGVVVGNFRTSLSGRDLNRTFRMTNDFMIPEVRVLKELVLRLKAEFKGRFMLFFDLHGHSVKKNVFLYGPEYQIWQTNYYKTRIFPKLLASKTDMFRYYSCVFRIAEYKRTTGRAAVLKNVPHCYTVESSAGFYYCHQEKKDIPFTPQKWILMGRKLGQALKEYVEILREESSMKEERKQKQLSFRTMRSRGVNSKKQTQKSISNRFSSRLVLTTTNKAKFMEEEQKTIQEDVVSNKVRDIIERIKEDEKKFQEKGEESGHYSDNFSEGGSDSQPEDDIPEKELGQFQDTIFTYIQEYREKFYKEKGGFIGSSNQQPKKKLTIKQEEKRSRRHSRGLQLIASLRKKKSDNAEKGKEVLIWGRMKDQFKHIRNRNTEDALNSRLLMTPETISPTSMRVNRHRRLNIESEILYRRQTTNGMRSLYDK